MLLALQFLVVHYAFKNLHVDGVIPKDLVLKYFPIIFKGDAFGASDGSCGFYNFDSCEDSPCSRI